ncbi:MAG: GspE/PulE family protein [Planctomycetes bacterium]|nr:GspE/PulE family protein [Planctomycetota bacterium]
MSAVETLPQEETATQDHERRPVTETELDWLESAPPSRAIERLAAHAAETGASDLFLLSEPDGVTAAVRWLGQVQPLGRVSHERGRRLIGAIKAAAEMDIAEHRHPLEGRWIHEGEGGRSLDLRVSTVPTLNGQDLAVRLLDRQAQFRSLDRLGLTPVDLSKLRLLLRKSGGLILVTGPTGAGKTTTLYASIAELNDGRRKINTLEDPIEFTLPGVRQSQTQPKIGLDFPQLLRGVLRQSPDVIMIGEIRDMETAATAVQAANSGHLVLATLHAPVAAGAVQAMLSLGAPPYFLSNCLLGVLAQRLVRVLCPECRARQEIAAPAFEEVRPWLGEEAPAIYAPVGCDACRGGGYESQTGVFELMTMNDELRDAIAAGRSRSELQRLAIAAGMLEFRRAALLRVAQGITSVEEVIRTMPSECFLETL